VTRGWRKQPVEEVYNLYFSLSIIRMIKSRGIRFAGHVARAGKRKNVCRILVGKLEGKRQGEGKIYLGG
jgi:hypothetical protein